MAANGVRRGAVVPERTWGLPAAELLPVGVVAPGGQEGRCPGARGRPPAPAPRVRAGRHADSDKKVRSRGGEAPGTGYPACLPRIPPAVLRLVVRLACRRDGLHERAKDSGALLRVQVFGVG